MVLTLLMTARRDLKVFIKINSYGVIFVIAIIVCIISIGVYSLSNTQYTFNISKYNEHISSGDISYLAYINMASKSFPPLMGILGGGFYFHNISLPVIRNARNP
jgi:amino acid transporter